MKIIIMEQIKIIMVDHLTHVHSH